MWIAIQLQVAEVLKSFSPSLRGNQLLSGETSENLSHFDVEEMRSVHRLRNGKDTLIDLDPRGRLKKPLDGGGRI
jgi:hypothetical protein